MMDYVTVYTSNIFNILCKKGSDRNDEIKKEPFNILFAVKDKYILMVNVNHLPYTN